ncbi:RNA polymerase sigma factor [Flavitalea flava]
MSNLLPDIETLLLQRIANGDEQAFSAVLRKYWNTVFSHALAYLKSVERAEETTQDIFLKLWRSRSTLSEVKSLKNYLFIIARNHIYNEARKRIDRLFFPSDQIHAADPLPHQQTEYRETYQILLRGVELLPEKRKRVFKMSRFEGMTNEQIAESLGMHKDTVYQYLTKALGFLKVYVQENAGVPLWVIILIAEIK